MILTTIRFCLSDVSKNCTWRSGSDLSIMITITLNNNNNSILNATINIPIYVHSMIPIKMTLMKLNYNILAETWLSLHSNKIKQCLTQIQCQSYKNCNMITEIMGLDKVLYLPFFLFSFFSGWSPLCYLWRLLCRRLLEHNKLAHKLLHPTPTHHSDNYPVMAGVWRRSASNSKPKFTK